MNLRAFFVDRTEHGFVHIARAALSSSVAFAVDFAILVILVEKAGVHYLIAATIGFTVGTTITYVLSVNWIFPRRRLDHPAAEYGLFIAVGVVGVVLNDLFLWIFTDVLSIYYMISRVGSGSLVFFWNFFARKFLLFR